MSERFTQTAQVNFEDGTRLQLPSSEFWLSVGAVLAILVRLHPRNEIEYMKLMDAPITSVEYTKMGAHTLETLVQNHPNATLPTLTLEIRDQERYIQPFSFETTDDRIVFRQG
jgi:hypothetical protein